MTNIDIPYSKTFLNSLLELDNQTNPQFCPDMDNSGIDVCYNLMKNITTQSWQNGDGKNIQDCSNLVEGSFMLNNDVPSAAKCCRGDVNKSCYQYIIESSGNTESSDLLNFVFAQDDYFTGIYDYNYEGSGNVSGKICLTTPFKEKLPNFVNFTKQLFQLMAGMLITVLMATCTEFWFKYGHSIDCIFYRSKCGNLNENNKASIIDYIFPESLCYYPYQKCLYEDSKLSGGSKQKGGDTIGENVKYGFNSMFKEYKSNGAKCITIHDSKEMANHRIFPYNLADLANEYISYEIIRKPAKAISFYAAHSNIAGRWFINGFLKNLSVLYQDYIQKNDYLTTIIYILCFLFYFFIFGIINIFSILFTFMGGFLLSTARSISPPAFLKKILEKCKNGPENGHEYYQLYSALSSMSVVFFPKEGEEPPGIGKRFLNFLYNILKCLFIIPFNLIIVMIGLLTSLFCSFWQIISFIFYFFYVPLSNHLEFYDLVKNHGILLTLYFCSLVITASYNSLDIKTTYAMSGCFAFIVIYYFIKYSGK